jgi:hypothetical protein
LNWTTLYHCRVRHKRACRLTLSGTKTFTNTVESHQVGYPERSGPTIDTETVTVSWSITFVPIGTSNH